MRYQKESEKLCARGCGLSHTPYNDYMNNTAITSNFNGHTGQYVVPGIGAYWRIQGGELYGKWCVSFNGGRQYVVESGAIALQHFADRA